MDLADNQGRINYFIRRLQLYQKKLWEMRRNLSKGEAESLEGLTRSPSSAVLERQKNLCCVLSLATMATATGGRCSWVARQASGVRAEGGSKFCAFFTCWGQQLIFLLVLSALGAAICSPDRELPHSLVGAGGFRTDVGVATRKEAM